MAMRFRILTTCVALSLLVGGCANMSPEQQAALSFGTGGAAAGAALGALFGPTALAGAAIGGAGGAAYGALTR
jgi:hypothetical protein